MERNFSLRAVLSVSTGIIVSYRAEYMGLIGFMWDRSCNTDIEYMAMSPEAQLHLTARYPHLSADALAAELQELNELITDKPRAFVRFACLQWVEGLVPTLGDQISVAQIPPQNRLPFDIETETAKIVHPDRIIKT